MKCDYCKDGKYFGLHFVEECTYCNGTGFKEAPVPPPTNGPIMVGEIEDLILSSLKSQIQGQYNPALTSRGNINFDTVVMLNLDPALNPTIKAIENNSAFLGLVADLVYKIDFELYSIRGGQWAVQRPPVNFMLGLYSHTSGLQIDWTNPGKNPRRLQVKAKVHVG